MLLRVTAVLLSAAATMLAVVVLRAETRRYEYLTANADWEAQHLRQALHEREFELARLRDPSRIRERVVGRQLAEELGGNSAVTQPTASPAKSTGQGAATRSQGNSPPRKPGGSGTRGNTPRRP